MTQWLEALGLVPHAEDTVLFPALTLIATQLPTTPVLGHLVPSSGLHGYTYTNRRNCLKKNLPTFRVLVIITHWGLIAISSNNSTS